MGGGSSSAWTRAGIRSIEHGIYLDDEATELMLTRRTFFVPTLVAPHGRSLRELALMAAGGMSPADVLVAGAA